MDVSESVEFGRVHDQLYPTHVDVDNTYPGPLVDGLRQRGHNVTGPSQILPFGFTIGVEEKPQFWMLTVWQRPFRRL